MFHHTYETTACSSYPLRELRIALERAKINGDLRSVTTSKGQRLKNVLQVTPYTKAIPPFHHPIEIEATDGEKLYVIDQRPNQSIARGDELKVSQQNQYDFLALRAALERLWNTGSREDMQFLGQVPVRAYARNLAENLVRRLGLSREDHQKLMALTAYYYQCQFLEEKTLDEDRKLAMAVRIRNYIGVPTDVTLPLIDGLPVLGDLEDYCGAVRDALQTPRVAKLNAAFVMSVSMGIWFGNNARETVAVALEYPPAFLAMVYTAINDRSMNSAIFSKLVNEIAKGASATEFNNGMKACLEAAHDV